MEPMTKTVFLYEALQPLEYGSLGMRLKTRSSKLVNSRIIDSTGNYRAANLLAWRFTYSFLPTLRMKLPCTDLISSYHVMDSEEASFTVAITVSQS
jgi:hypothetical protein